MDNCRTIEFHFFFFIYTTSYGISFTFSIGNYLRSRFRYSWALYEKGYYIHDRNQQIHTVNALL